MSIPAIPKDYYGHKTELFLDNLCNQESDNLRDHKQTEKEKGPETILIVDDDSEIREILRILLCRNGFIVKEAADAKEALLKLDSSIDFFFC